MFLIRYIYDLFRFKSKQNMDTLTLLIVDILEPWLPFPIVFVLFLASRGRSAILEKRIQSRNWRCRLLDNDRFWVGKIKRLMSGGTTSRFIPSQSSSICAENNCEKLNELHLSIMNPKTTCAEFLLICAGKSLRHPGYVALAFSEGRLDLSEALVRTGAVASSLILHVAAGDKRALFLLELQTCNLANEPHWAAFIRHFGIRGLCCCSNLDARLLKLVLKSDDSSLLESMGSWLPPVIHQSELNVEDILRGSVLLGLRGVRIVIRSGALLSAFETETDAWRTLVERYVDEEDVLTWLSKEMTTLAMHQLAKFSRETMLRLCHILYFGGWASSRDIPQSMLDELMWQGYEDIAYACASGYGYPENIRRAIRYAGSPRLLASLGELSSFPSAKLADGP
jgi:hypothetical protein